MKTNDLKTLGLVALGAAVIILRRIRNVSGVGKAERIKRRIYKEVSLAQQAGVDFSKKYPELSTEELDALRELGEQMGWKQSKRAMESGKPYAESYYSSLRRAWNAVSGLDGAIGKAYTVRDANGNTVLTWIEDAAAHVEAEKRLQELDRKLAAQRRAAKRRQREMQNIVLNPAPNFQDEADEVEYRVQQENAEPTQYLTIQQQLLQKLPYLKTLTDDGWQVRDDFNYVIWRTEKSPQGKVIFEGPMMAFFNKGDAEKLKPRNVKNADYNGNVNQWITFSVKPVSDIKIEKISGLNHFAL